MFLGWCRKSFGCCLPSFIAQVVPLLCLYLDVGLPPYARPGKNVLFGCCVGGSGNRVTPGYVCRPFFGRSLGSCRARTDLGCSCHYAGCRGLSHSRPIFCHSMDLRIPVGICPPFGIIPRPVPTCSGVQCAGRVLLADLANCTHTGSLCVTVSGISCNVSSLCILL